MKVITSKHFFFIKEDVLRLSSTQERTSTSYLVETSYLFFKVVIFVLLMFFHSHFLFPLQGERSFAQRGSCFRILLSRVFDKVTVMENRWIDEVFVVLISTQFPVLSVTNCKFQVNSTFDLSETNSTCAPFCKTHVANLETETKIVALCFRSAS